MTSTPVDEHLLETGDSDNELRQNDQVINNSTMICGAAESTNKLPESTVHTDEVAKVVVAKQAPRPFSRHSARKISGPKFAMYMPPKTLQTVTVTAVTPSPSTASGAVFRTPPSELDPPSCILPNLFLGGYINASDLTHIKHLDIKNILCCAKEFDPICYDEMSKLQTISEGADNEPSYYFDIDNRITIMHIKIYDHSDENIAQYFEKSSKFIHNALMKGEGVLVHCQRGISRSPTLVLAYLMDHGLDPLNITKNMSYEEAFDHIKSKRNIGPNLGFVLSLHDHDKVVKERSFF